MARKITKEEFIEKARQVHGDKYDYSKVEYINNHTKVCIICPIHGEFFIKPSEHIYSKCGCVKCSGREHGTTESFIEKARKVHGNKYDYSKVEYVNSKTKVCIICNEKNILGEIHGEFWQRPNDHLSGYACTKCGNNLSPTISEVIYKARKVHGDKYDYSKVEYKNAHEKICIICPNHGEFWQIPNNHLNGCGCPSCNSDNKSKMEEEIHKKLESKNIKHERQKTFPWLKHKRSLFLDFYLPYKKIAIEVQGEQHFVPIKRFGGVEYLKMQQERDKVKKRLCEEHNIKIFYITKRNYNIENIIQEIENIKKNGE